LTVSVDPSWPMSRSFSPFRWIFENRDIFAGKRVLGLSFVFPAPKACYCAELVIFMTFLTSELGSGVGLPGLTAAYFALEVVLSDHIPEVSFYYEPVL